MKKKKYIILSFVILTVIGLFITGKVYNDLGLFLDSYSIAGTVPTYVIPGASLSFLLLFACFFVSLILLYFYTYKNIPKFVLPIHLIVIIVILIYSTIISIKCANYMDRYTLENGIQANCTLEELKEAMASNQSVFIYFKRDDCPACLQIESELSEYLKNCTSTYMCYSTSADRIDRSEMMWEQLNNYNIRTVPTLLYMENGDIVYHYEGTDILTFIRNTPGISLSATPHSGR